MPPPRPTTHDPAERRGIRWHLALHQTRSRVCTRCPVCPSVRPSTHPPVCVLCTRRVPCHVYPKLPAYCTAFMALGFDGGSAGARPGTGAGALMHASHVAIRCTALPSAHTRPILASSAVRCRALPCAAVHGAGHGPRCSASPMRLSFLWNRRETFHRPSSMPTPLCCTRPRLSVLGRLCQRLDLYAASVPPPARTLTRCVATRNSSGPGPRYLVWPLRPLSEPRPAPTRYGFFSQPRFACPRGENTYAACLVIGRGESSHPRPQIHIALAASCTLFCFRIHRQLRTRHLLSSLHDRALKRTILHPRRLDPSARSCPDSS